MPKYKRWHEVDVQSALISIEDGEPICKSARIHGVPESTLRYRIYHKTEKNQKLHLSIDDESQIAKYAGFMSSIGHPCSVIWLRQLAARIANKRYVYIRLLLLLL